MPVDVTGLCANELYGDAAGSSAFRAATETATRSAGSVGAVPAVLRRHDGAARSVLLSVQKLIVEPECAGEPASGHLVTAVIDRTEEKEQEERLRASEVEYRTLFENASIGIYRSTPEGRMLRANPALVVLNGYDTEADLVIRVGDIAEEWYVDPRRREVFKRLMMEEGAVNDFVSEVYRHKTRERIWVSENAWAVRDVAGNIVYYEGSIVEATERRQAEALNEQLARHDPLTGLANRRLFNERLVQALANPAVPSRYLAVLYLDIDGFKAINDQHGHAAGDALLVEIAQRLRGACRMLDTVARNGGDEFIILQNGLDQLDDSKILASRIIKSFERPFQIGARSQRIGISIGIAGCPAGGSNAAALVQRADEALYRAKSKGRNRFEIADDSAGSVGDAQRRDGRRRHVDVEDERGQVGYH